MDEQAHVKRGCDSNISVTRDVMHHAVYTHYDPLLRSGDCTAGRMTRANCQDGELLNYVQKRPNFAFSGIFGSKLRGSLTPPASRCGEARRAGGAGFFDSKPAKANATCPQPLTSKSVMLPSTYMHQGGGIAVWSGKEKKGCRQASHVQQYE